MSAFMGEVVGTMIGGALGSVFYQMVFLQKFTSMSWIVLGVAAVLLF